MNEVNGKVITLKDLWDIFVRRVIWMVLAAVIVGTAFLVVDKATFTPQYQSTATLYLLRDDEEDSSSVVDAYNSYSLAMKVVNDCTYMLKSRTVVDQVISDLGLSGSYESLVGKISTSNPENTRFLEVTVRADSPETAKLIVDSLCERGRDQINNALGYEQVMLYEYGVLRSAPSNTRGMTSYLLPAAAAAVVVYAVFLIIFLLDDRIRSADDIERVLGLTVLGEIPDQKDVRKNKKLTEAGTRRTKTGTRHGAETSGKWVRRG